VSRVRRTRAKAELGTGHSSRLCAVDALECSAAIDGAVCAGTRCDALDAGRRELIKSTTTERGSCRIPFYRRVAGCEREPARANASTQSEAGTS